MASTGQIMAALNKVASQQVEFAARQDQMGCQIEKNNAQLSLGILSKSTSQANNKFWFGMGSTFLPFAVSGISSFLKLDAETTKKATEKVMSVANTWFENNQTLASLNIQGAQQSLQQGQGLVQKLHDAGSTSRQTLASILDTMRQVSKAS
jgi:hypothetical protein